ncbi:MAG: thioredoxin domain-containing protein, partial [Candidatus Heimdallarchaeota archaeon]|nr:thioredoxin domain-containing protein [Candidatus Heimdallarchaeota archaeon]
IKLFTEREKRIKPSVDTKILVSWNSLAIRALLVAAESLDFPEAAVLAQDALQFILDNLVRENHIIRNYHTSTESQNERQIEGILDDYSFLIAALIQAFEYFDDWNYIVLAKKLLALADEKFFDPDAGVYFLNSKSESQVLGRIIQVSDDSMPSGLGLMPLNLFKLGKYTENEEMLSKGLKVSERFVERINDYPGAMNNLMISSTPYIRHPIEIVVINDPENLLNAAYSSAYLSHRLIYRWNAANKNDGRPEWQVLEHRTNVDKETIFICEGMTCSLPMNDPESVSKYLEQVYKSKDKL